jgi:hypothetical protein
MIGYILFQISLVTVSVCIAVLSGRRFVKKDLERAERKRIDALFSALMGFPYKK